MWMRSSHCDGSLLIVACNDNRCITSINIIFIPLTHNRSMASINRSVAVASAAM
jgi:hypothetical protein